MNKLILIGAALLGLSASGFACKYVAVDLKDNVSLAQDVFLARAETSSNGKNGSGADVPSMMRVSQVVKGSTHVGQLVPVYTSNSSCGLGIQKGQLWLILGGGEPLQSDQPSGSVLLNDQAARNLVSKTLGLMLP